MRGICHLSRRWHQQFSSSPSFVGHHSCLQALIPIRTYRQPARTRPASARKSMIGRTTKVHEFEKFKNDRLTKGSVGADVLDQEKELVENQLRRLEDELAILKQGPFGPKSDLMQSLSIEERGKLLQELENRGVTVGEGQDFINDDDLDELEDFEDVEDDPKPQNGSLRVQLRVPVKDKVYVGRFNKVLEVAQAETENTAHRLNLWKWYLRCQQNVPNFSRVLSEDVWRFLWIAQRKLDLRSKPLIVLATDMLAAGVKLDNEQLLEYMGSLHSNGDTASALAIWEQEKEHISSDTMYGPRYWELGVELYAALGRPQKAQDIAFEAFKHNDNIDPKILSSVVLAWTDSHHPRAYEKSWYCYLQMRSILEKQILKDGTSNQVPVDILSQISARLLKAGRKDMALAIFKDAIEFQQQTPQDSWKVYKDALRNFKDLNPSVIREDDINQIGLAALVIFPKSFQNKFFFGSWIKWLIGEGKIDDAALVVELMQERGLRPDARHLNGIVGAWLRDGSSTARDKAERLAWAMIHSRIDLVTSRTGKDNVKLPQVTNSSNQISPYIDKKRLPSFLLRHIPAATLETFSLLLLQYTRRSELSKAEYLTEVLCGPAQLRPNVFIMNHWLYASLRGSDLMAVWYRYNNLKQEIEPDLETFTVLWDSAKANEDWFGKQHVKDFPSPRALFREMREWQDKLSGDRISDTMKSFDRDLYEQIIRCFCLSSDLRGVFCALRGLKAYFDLLPHEDAARMILMQIARTMPSRFSNTSKPGRPRRDSRYRSALQEFVGIMESITEKHAAQAFDNGITTERIDDPTREIANGIRLKSLCDLILMVLDRQLKPNPQGSNDINNQIITVASSMLVAKEHLFD